MPRLENWRPIEHPMEKLIAALTGCGPVVHLRGTTVGDDRTNTEGEPMEGTEIVTSQLLEINHKERFAVTATKTRYELGKINAEYVALVKENDPEGYKQLCVDGYETADAALAN